MNSDRRHTEYLIRKALLEIKSGYPENGRRYLERAELSTRDPHLRARIAYQFALLSADEQEKRQHLEQALAWNPTHPEARRALAVLEGRLKPQEIIDPDALPAPPPEQLAAESERFTCPQCGARLAYAPDGRSLYCESCASRQPFRRPANLEEQDFFVGMARLGGHRQPVAVQAFHCQGCGAEFTLPPEQLSASCAWCDSTHVIALEDRRDLLPPDGLIPHRFTARQAAALLKRWAKEEKRRPEGRVQPLRALYLPAWTFDLIGEIGWQGMAPESELPRYLQSRKDQHRRRPVSGQYPVHFDDLLLPAGKRLRQPFSALLPTYQLDDLQPYRAGYLADWPAELYDLPLAQASLQAREQAFRQARANARRDLAPQNLTDLRFSSSGLHITAYKLILLPVWHTRWPEDGQEWPLLLNGQTGRVLCYQPRKLPKWLDWLEDLFFD